MKRAIVFPGQGSQVVGMGADLAAEFPACKALFDRANELLGYDLAQICFEGPQEELNKSNHAQLGIFVTSVACFEALKVKHPAYQVDYMAGHSLGEWTALYASGVITFEDGLRILRARGEFMQAACEKNPGAMLAVMGVDGDMLEGVAADAGAYVANYNSLAQTVLSGSVGAIEKAEALCGEAGAKRCVRLPVAGAFHSPLMQPAADKLKIFIEEIPFSEEQTPVLSNVTGMPHGTSSVKEDMIRQVTSSVQWVKIVQDLAELGVEEIVECGPGKVLAGLIKRIDKRCKVLNMGTLEDF
jgi:[acyl-carrier-protein] S-malonyltransferase